MSFQYRGLTQTTAPDRFPVTVQQVKDQLKISGDTENELIELYIGASVKYLEDKLGLAMITQVWQMTLDHWPGYKEKWWNGTRQMHQNALYADVTSREIPLPIFPLQTVDSMTVDGSSVTLATYFTTDTTQRPGRLVLKFGQTWPTLTNEVAAGIVINFTAGYGAAASAVPADLKLAILAMCAYMFTHRGDDCDVVKAFEKSGAKSLTSNYAKVRF